MKRLILPTLALTTVLAALAPAHADPRIATRLYLGTDVVVVHGRAGIESTIAFADDEKIENIAVGDSAAWQVTPNKRANLLFVKPAANRARTNMTVVTDQHTYLFDLVSAPAAPAVYMLRFSYPARPHAVEPKLAAAALAAATTIVAKPLSPAPDPAALNFAWLPHGDKRLLPDRSFDDGHSTFLQWPKDATLPAILVRESNGIEGPVNYTVRGDYIVVEGVPDQLILRQGKQIATLTPAAHREAPDSMTATPRTTLADAITPSRPFAHVAGWSAMNRDTTTARPNRLILQPLGEIDPRSLLDERSLIDASRNAFPIVAGNRAKKDSFGLVAGGGVALLLGGLTFWSMSGHRAMPHPQDAQPALPVAAPLMPGTLPIAPPVPPSRSLMMPSVPSIAMTPVAKPAPAPVMVFDAGSAPAQTAAQAAISPTPSTAAAVRRGVAAGGSDNDQFANRVGDGEVQVASAQQLSDPSMTVTQGTLIPAVLETAIDTDLPGYVRALVSRDVRSFDGKQVLIPRSSRLIGQYKSGLAAGQTRAYVIWTRLIRPDGASVALASPAVDFAGNSGLVGKVDGHFMQRFGSAALLSVVGGLGALGSSGTSVILSGGGQSAASVAAQRDTAIPPTIKVAQGQPIRVFTARDLDFSTVAPLVASK